jgi:hypothetical protein
MQVVIIETGEILAGRLPNKAVRLVREWAKEHQEELLIVGVSSGFKIIKSYFRSR